MATVNLTERGIAALKANGKRSDIWDSLVPGFHVRVNRDGSKTFAIRYRASGAQRRMKLGAYPTMTLSKARERARAALTDVAAGNDPAAEKAARRDHDVTFAALAREVLNAKAKPGSNGKAPTSPATQRERERLLKAELLPRWRSRPVASITKRDVVLLVERIAERAPIVANRTLTLINVIFNEGLRRGFPTLEYNPAHLIRPPAVEGRRERFLTRDEIKVVWNAVADESPSTRGIFRLALLTGQRVGAVKALRWREIDGANIWRTPAPEFKGKRDHLTPLSAEALAELDAIRPLTGDGEYVFPGRSGGPRGSVNKALQRVRERSELPSWTIHDFRRTFRTHAVRAAEDGGLGIAPNVADAVLGHKEASLGFDRYTGEPERYLLAEKRDALAKWGAFVVAIEARV